MLKALVALLIGSVPAQAAVFSFQPTAIGSALPFCTPDMMAFSLGIDDDTIDTDHFSYRLAVQYVDTDGHTALARVATGNVTSLQSFKTANGLLSFGSGNGPSAGPDDFFTANLKFAAGQITEGRIAYSSDMGGIEVDIADGSFAGTFVLGTFGVPETVTGTVSSRPMSASIPEPAAGGVVALALAAAWLGRRWRARKDSNFQPPDS